MFDYNRAEAIALARRRHGKHTNAEMVIMDPPPAGTKSLRDGHERIKVQTVDGKAQVLLNDAKGRARLRFTVPKRS